MGGEVVNGDSMQVYVGMDVGTAKLTPPERRGIAHHVLDVLEVTEPSTVAEFQCWARAAIDDCRARGVTPVFVGGSALYLRAVLDEFEFPGTDPAIRARQQHLAEHGPAALHARLASIDPDASSDSAGQRSTHRPRTGGHRADRRAVQGRAARARLRL